MYIPEFVCGIIATVLAELVLVLILAFAGNGKGKK